MNQNLISHVIVGFAVQIIDGALGMAYDLSSMIFLLTLGGVLAAPLAAYLCRRLPARALLFLVGALIIILSVRTILLAVFA